MPIAVVRRMRFPLKFVVVAAALAGVSWGAYRPIAAYLQEKNRPTFREAKAVRRTITSVVNSTGEVKPVLRVSVGSFVSGPIERLHVGFNDRVAKNQLLAEIDPRIYVAAVAGAKAALVTRKADVERVQALLQQAVNDERRSIALRRENPDFISQTEIDHFHFNRLQLDAQLRVAEAAVDQAEASLNNSEANLNYTKIVSPVDGIIIDRKIDPGQTLAAQFQTPELFIVAPEMDKKMHIFASVDEADIGLIRRAQDEKQPVEFRVDAYPDDLFTGEIEQIRFSSTVTQNVVTYPVVVAAPNADLKLLPGMTASLSFQIAKKPDVLCVPNPALRFYPERRYVRAADRKLLEGADDDPAEDGSQEDGLDASLSAREKAEGSAQAARRHVWVVDGDQLRAIEIFVGISDNRFTEVVSGDLAEGQTLATGVKPPGTWDDED